MRYRSSRRTRSSKRLVSMLHPGRVRHSLIRWTTDLRTEDQPACLELVAELENRGFVRKTSVDGVFGVTKDQEKVRDARSEYLDPLARILDYVRAIHSGVVQGPRKPSCILGSNPVLSTSRLRIERLRRTERKQSRKLSIDTLMADYSI